MLLQLFTSHTGESRIEKATESGQEYLLQVDRLDTGNGWADDLQVNSTSLTNRSSVVEFYPFSFITYLVRSNSLVYLSAVIRWMDLSLWIHLRPKVLMIFSIYPIWLI